MLKRLGEKLLRLYCHPDFQEDILGDLEEYFRVNSSEKGEAYAERRFLLDAVMLFRFSLLRENWLSQKLIQTTMVKNNFKMAYRSMMRQKFYSFLNLTGLAIGMAACIFIAIFVKEELSFDKHFEDSDKIFRIAGNLKFGDNVFNLGFVPDPMAKTVKEEFPEVENAARTRGDATILVSYNNNYFRQTNIAWADQEFFSIFSIPLLRGDRNHLLDEPNTVVITESTAKKIFGSEDPLNKVIRFNDELDIKVTGVIQDIPDNTHFKYNMFVTMLNRADARQNVWLSNNFTTYVKLNAKESKATVDGRFPDFLMKHFAEQVNQMMGIKLEDAVASGALAATYFLQPVEDIYLYSNMDFELRTGGSIENVYIFSIIGFFILLIACINFMNMATARASVRAKEVGIRKVLGSLKSQLINQFLMESILSSFIAAIVAVIMVTLLLPSFNTLTDKQIVDPIFSMTGLWPYLLISTIMIGALAGVYPAFVLSSFSPSKVLKGEVTQGKKAGWMRNILVIIQFSTSIFLIIGSAFIYNQLDYLQHKELGFNKDQILVINETQLLGNQLQAFKTELERNPLVESVSVSGFIPATNIYNDSPFLSENATSAEEGVSLQIWFVDQDYARTYDLKIEDGRFFSKEFASDSSAMVLNEAAIKRFGYTDNPIGRRIKALNGNNIYTIVGVVKDFHFKSMTEEIQPQVFFLGNSPDNVSVKFKANMTNEVLATTKASWESFSGGKPFEYDFLDQIFADSFKNQIRVKTIFSVFAVLAVSIACLGLFGLAAYVTEQRKKEIGIRKVLGASMSTLLTLLFRSFTFLILISAVLAIPLAWWYMDGWLSDFPFRVDMNPLVFIGSALGTLFIALLTVGYQSMTAARRNPIENLRNE
uniref:ABC transporter permease n=1 Tax=Roseivirga sp. TaxID=1964215 RepID=UPI00404898CC